METEENGTSCCSIWVPNTRGPELWKGRPCNSHCCPVCVTTDQETYAVPLNQSKLLNIYSFPALYTAMSEACVHVKVLQFRPWVSIHVTSTCALASREGLYGFRTLPTHRPQRENCVAQIIGPVERFITWSVKRILHWHLRIEPADLLHSKQKTRYTWPEEVNPSQAHKHVSFEFQAFNSTLSHKHWPLLLDRSLQNWFEDITIDYQATKLPRKSD